MASTLFWTVIVIASLIVLCKMHIMAEHNVAGEQKVNGKWVQTMYPDHYTFLVMYMVYWGGAFIIAALLYLVLASLLEISGFAESWGIQTGFKVIFG